MISIRTPFVGGYFSGISSKVIRTESGFRSREKKIADCGLGREESRKAETAQRRQVLFAADGADGRRWRGAEVATDYDPEDDFDVFAHDLTTGITQLVSINAVGTNAGNQESRIPIVSADGAVVIFRSDATDLVAGDDSSIYDVFVAQVSWDVPQLTGDYNLDGRVDAADYSVWRDALGQSGLALYEGADGSENGSIGPEAYAIWMANFGRTIVAGNREQGEKSREQGA